MEEEVESGGMAMPVEVPGTGPVPSQSLEAPPVDDVPPGEIDPSAPVQEPYGSTVLRTVHADATALMEDYHSMMGVLDNPKVRAHMERLLAAFEGNLSKIEMLFADQYAHCDPLEASMEPEPGNTDMTTMETEGQESPANPSPDPSMPLPSPNDVAAAMANEKSMGKKAKKSMDESSMEDWETKGCACPSCGGPVEADMPSVLITHGLTGPDDDAWDTNMVKEALGFLDEISNDTQPWDDEKAMKSYAYHKIMEDAADKAEKSIVKAMANAIPAATLAAQTTDSSQRKRRMGQKSEGDGMMPGTSDPMAMDPLDKALCALGIKSQQEEAMADKIVDDDEWGFGISPNTTEQLTAWLQMLESPDNVPDGAKAMSWLSDSTGGALVAPAKSCVVLPIAKKASAFLKGMSKRRESGMRDRAKAARMLKGIKAALAVKDELTPEQIAEISDVYEPGQMGSKADKPSVWQRLRDLFAGQNADDVRAQRQGQGAGRREGRTFRPNNQPKKPQETLDVFDGPATEAEQRLASENQGRTGPGPQTPAMRQAADVVDRMPSTLSSSGKKPDAFAGYRHAENRQGVNRVRGQGVDRVDVGTSGSPAIADHPNAKPVVTKVPQGQKPTGPVVATSRQPKPQSGYSAGTANASNRSEAPDAGARRAADPKVTSRIATPTTQGHKPTGEGTASNAAPGMGRNQSTTTADSGSASTQQMADYFKSGKSLETTNHELDKMLALLDAE